jgi:hypothetical protein
VRYPRSGWRCGRGTLHTSAHRGHRMYSTCRVHVTATTVSRFPQVGQEGGWKRGSSRRSPGPAVTRFGTNADECNGAMWGGGTRANGETDCYEKSRDPQYSSGSRAPIRSCTDRIGRIPHRDQRAIGDDSKPKLVLVCRPRRSPRRGSAGRFRDDARASAIRRGHGRDGFGTSHRSSHARHWRINASTVRS